MEEERRIHPGTFSIPITGESHGMVRSVRDTPPAHFCCRIESFKLLSDSLFKRGAEKHEMDTFESCGFRWRLSLYPKGDKKRNGEGHLSLYLVLAGADSSYSCSEAFAVFKLFLYDHIRAEYLIVEQDVSGASRFDMLKSEVGFSRFIPLSTFNDKSSGFKEGESCIFGAEVYVTGTSQGMPKEVRISNLAPSETYSFVVDSSALLDCEYYDCTSFRSRGRKWFIRLQTHTSPEGKRYVCFALVLADRASTPPSIIARWRRSSRIGGATEVAMYVTGTMRIDDQVHSKHIERDFCQVYRCPKVGEFQKLLKMDHLNDSSKGFVKDGKIKAGLHISSILELRDDLI